MITTQSKSKGFSLIEAVVAVTLMTIAIVGPMTLSAQSLRATREARLQLIATHLAQEGIEIVHNIRGNNSSKDSSPNRVEWMDGSAPYTQLDIISECGNGGFGCIPDVVEHSGVSGATGGGTGVWTEKALVHCDGICSKIVYQNPITGLYRQSKTGLSSPWVVSPFTRVVYVTGVDNSQNPVRQVRVRSEVTYESYGGTRTISANGDLYNWFPKLN